MIFLQACKATLDSYKQHHCVHDWYLAHSTRIVLIYAILKLNARQRMEEASDLVQYFSHLKGPQVNQILYPQDHSCLVKGITDFFCILWAGRNATAVIAELTWLSLPALNMYASHSSHP